MPTERNEGDDGNAEDDIAGDGSVEDDVAGDESGEADEFTRELARASSLLDADDVDGAFVGVVSDGEVDTTFTQRAADREEEGLQALALLAAHVRLVANEAGVEPATVAGDAATLAGQVEELPGSTDAVPDE